MYTNLCEEFPKVVNQRTTTKAKLEIKRTKFLFKQIVKVKCVIYFVVFAILSFVAVFLYIFTLYGGLYILHIYRMRIQCMHKIELITPIRIHSSKLTIFLVLNPEFVKLSLNIELSIVCTARHRRFPAFPLHITLTHTHTQRNLTLFFHTCMRIILRNYSVCVQIDMHWCIQWHRCVYYALSLAFTLLKYDSFELILEQSKCQT